METLRFIEDTSCSEGVGDIAGDSESVLLPRGKLQNSKNCQKYERNVQAPTKSKLRRLLVSLDGGLGRDVATTIVRSLKLKN